MNTKLLDYIKVLSKQDPKTLSQKALKTCEEVGELAKWTLPYDGAFATNHRFTTRERILEEAVDTMLCALSIAYDLDFTDGEIEEMMNLKSTKWAGLQAAEVGLKYPLPYEIHITVDMTESRPFSGWEDIDDSKSLAELSIDKFKYACSVADVKPILLDLQCQNGTVIKDVMTSSKHFGNNRSAYEESQRISHALGIRGFKVVRTKIETVPWHPAAPQKQGGHMPAHCYFESHIGLIINPETFYTNDQGRLAYVIDGYSVHVSSNVFKKRVDGTEVIMLTYRSTTNFESFKIIFDALLAKLDSAGFTYEKPIVEFSVYDTKVSHDTNWIKG